MEHLELINETSLYAISKNYWSILNIIKVPWFTRRIDILNFHPLLYYTHRYYSAIPSFIKCLPPFITILSPKIPSFIWPKTPQNDLQNIQYASGQRKLSKLSTILTLFDFAGHPDTPRNCSLLNQTIDSLYVECIEGFDGGLPQKFTIQVDRDSGTGSTSSKPSTTVYNQTSKVPSFSVGNLEPGTTYDVYIYASNSKGRSESVHFRATTLNLPERRTGEFSDHEFQ